MKLLAAILFSMLITTSPLFAATEKDQLKIRLGTPLHDEIDSAPVCGISGGGSLPSSVPAPYNAIFTKAGEKHGVYPALVAAIFFAGEHASH